MDEMITHLIREIKHAYLMAMASQNYYKMQEMITLYRELMKKKDDVQMQGGLF